MYKQIFVYSGPSKRVVSWSSLDWDRGRWNQFDLVLGTLFDVLIHAMNSKSVQPVFNFTTLKNFPLELPSLDIQNKAAGSLDCLDKKITKYQNLTFIQIKSSG